MVNGMIFWLFDHLIEFFSICVVFSITYILVKTILNSNPEKLFDFMKEVHASSNGVQSWNRWANTTVIVLTFLLTYIQLIFSDKTDDYLIMGLIGMALGSKVLHKHAEKQNKNNENN